MTRGANKWVARKQAGRSSAGDEGTQSALTAAAGDGKQNSSVSPHSTLSTDWTDELIIHDIMELDVNELLRRERGYGDVNTFCFTFSSLPFSAYCFSSVKQSRCINANFSFNFGFIVLCMML